jgi:hypothetical protein
MADSRKYVVRIVLLLVAAVMLTLFLASVALAKRDASVYPSNISVGGVELDGLDRETAGRILTDQLPENYGRELLLQTPSRSVSIPISLAGIDYDIPATLAKIDETLQPEGLAGVFTHSISRGSIQDIVPEMVWNTTLLQQQLSAIKRDYDQPAVDARILYSNDYLDYISHKKGYSIDVAASLDSICAALAKGSLGPVPLIVQETHPHVRLEDIKEVKDILGVSASIIDESSPEFSSLLEICNGLIVMPRDSLSINKIIKIKQIKLSDSALTVLYNNLDRACSEAGLNIQDRGTIKNELQHPVLIASAIDGSSFIIKIFGCQTEAGKEIKFLTEKKELPPVVKMKVNNKLSPQQRLIQQEGKSGYINRCYRIVEINGKQVEKTLLSEEFTPGQDTIIAVGPGTIKK